MKTPEQTKADLDAAIDATLLEAMRYSGDGLRDFSRNRKLPPQTVMRALLAFRGGSLRAELHDLGLEASASAFVQQRDKLSASAFRSVMTRFNATYTDAATFRGYRLLAADGTGLNIPYDATSRFRIPSPSNERGFCQIHLNLLYDIVNNLYVDCIENADEIGALYTMIYSNKSTRPTILILDRGYESYNTLAHLLNKPNLYFVLRVKQDKSAMRDIARLPMEELDRALSVTITTTQTNRDKSENRVLIKTRGKNSNGKAHGNRTRWDFPSPYELNFRVVRIMLNVGDYETLVTNLPHSFTADDIRALYHQRWGIETSFRNLKYTVGLINIHAKKDNSIFQEIFAALTFYNFANRVSRAAVIENKPDNRYEYRVDFKMATRLCREFYRTPDADGDKLLRDIARYTVPIRLGRQDKRNLKAKSFAGFCYRVAA